VIVVAIGAALLHIFPSYVTKPIDKNSIELRAGHAYSAPVATLLPSGSASWFLDLHPDSNEDGTGSRLRLLEDGRPLPMPHAIHEHIERLGSGQFSHWAGSVIFATPDNSNPRSNGRTYAVAYPLSPSWWIVWILAGAGALGVKRLSPAAAGKAPAVIFWIGLAGMSAFCLWSFAVLLAAPHVSPDANGYLVWSLLRTWGYPILLHAYHFAFGSWAYLPLFQLGLLLAGVALLAYAIARVCRSYFAGWLVVSLVSVGGTMLLSAAHLLTEAPFSALFMAHIAATVLFFESGRRPWAVVAGLTLAGAVAIKSVGLVLLGPMLLMLTGRPRERRALLGWVFLPAILAWLLPSMVNFSRFGTFESSNAGGFALGGHVAWAIHPRPDGKLPVEARIVEDAVAPILAKRPPSFESPLAYAEYTANEYNVLLWRSIVPRLSAYYEGLRPPEPCTWPGGTEACIARHTLSINRTLLQLSKEAIAAEPAPYMRHVAIHSFALWRDAFGAPNDFLRGVHDIAGMLPAAYNPARNSYLEMLAPLPPFKSEAERWGHVAAFEGSPLRRLLDLATLREGTGWIRKEIFNDSPRSMLALGILASLLVLFARRASSATLALCYTALGVNAYFAGTALAQPSLVRYAEVMQGALAALLVLALFVPGRKLWLHAARWRPGEKRRGR